MSNLIIVNNPDDWPLKIPSVAVVAARSYVTDPVFNSLRGIRVFNLCRSYAYQSLGYYVSLLAEARNQRPHPDITTIQDFKAPGTVRVLTEDLDEMIQRNLKSIQSDEFVLSIYFGKNLADKYTRLARRLFLLFQAPMMRAWFVRDRERWSMKSIRAISTNDVPKGHAPFLLDAARSFFARKPRAQRAQSRPRFHLAILTDPAETDPPSDHRALQKMQKAAQKVGFGVEIITKDDLGRIGAFDALFIRVTTGVNHYSYRFARRAEAEGLVVMDDPQSISRCMNKVYLAQRLANQGVPTPKTLVVHKDNRDVVTAALGLPCVLKQPDSAFSQGVCKVETAEELDQQVRALLDKSDLIIAQEFTPSEYDWRIGILNREALYACKYHMAKAHWQIIHNRPGKGTRYGKVDAVPLKEVPPHLLKTAVKAANLMGQGLYGVDMKQIGRRSLVIEVNDNPNLDAGYEDGILKDELYERIMRVFMNRVEGLKENGETEKRRRS